MIGNRFNIRERVRLDFRRCFAPTTPERLQTTAPPLDGEDIKSGQVVVLSSGTSQERPVVSGWRIANASDSARELYLAMADAADPDTQAAGALPAWPLREPAELDVGYVLLGEGESLTAGDLMTVGDGGYLVPYEEGGEGKPVARLAESGPIANGAFVSSAIHVEVATFFRLFSAPRGEPTEAEVAPSPPILDSYYLRPDGESRYLRTDGESLLLRP